MAYYRKSEACKMDKQSFYEKYIVTRSIDPSLKPYDALNLKPLTTLNLEENTSDEKPDERPIVTCEKYFLKAQYCKKLEFYNESLNDFKKAYAYAQKACSADNLIQDYVYWSKICFDAYELAITMDKENLVFFYAENAIKILFYTLEIFDDADQYNYINAINYLIISAIYLINYNNSKGYMEDKLNYFIDFANKLEKIKFKDTTIDQLSDENSDLYDESIYNNLSHFYFEFYKYLPDSLEDPYSLKVLEKAFDLQYKCYANEKKADYANFLTDIADYLLDEYYMQDSSDENTAKLNKTREIALECTEFAKNTTTDDYIDFKSLNSLFDDF